MISLVIPTMWNYDPFLDFLDYICKIDVIGEVIIINNDSSKTPEHESLRHSKVKMYDFGRNIKVNPAWNFGALIAQNPIVGFMNDDLIFDLKVFYKVNELMNNSDNIGTVGINLNRTDYGQPPLINGKIDLVKFEDGMACWGYGSLFFVYKEKWHPIPFGLDVWFGDVFTFDYYFHYGYDIYFLTNVFAIHNDGKEHGASNLPSEIVQTHEHEKLIYLKVKEKLLNKIPF